MSIVPNVANELMKEKIVLNQHIGKETMQLLLEGDIIVPDTKPDMAMMLKTDADVFFDSVEVGTDRINVSGKISIRILYLAQGHGKPIQSISISNAVDDFINMEGVTKDMWVHVDVNVAHVDYKMVNDRKINYRAVVNVTVHAENSQEMDVVTGIVGLPDSQLKKSVLNIDRMFETKEDIIVIKDEMAIPPGQPNMYEILQSNITITNKDIKVANGRINLSGELVVATLYKGVDEDSVIEFVEHEVPFLGSVDVNSAKEGMFADVGMHVNDQYVQIRPNEDGEDRLIELEVSMGISVRISSESQIEILEDAHCINKQMLCKTEGIHYLQMICRNKNQCTVKELIQLDENCPKMLQIFRVCGRAQLDEVKMLDDKVMVEGVIHTEILYIAGNDDTPLYNYKMPIPYKQIIETKGSKSYMEADIALCVDHIGFNMLSETEVELRYLLSFQTKVTDRLQANVITDIEMTDMSKEQIDQMGSMVIYVVQKGDSLWSIAKKYNASIEDLVELNEIENPNKIYPGQKLLIVKKAVDIQD